MPRFGTGDLPPIVWEPRADCWSSTRMGRFAREHAPQAMGDYDALWAWSTEATGRFWRAVWDHFEVDALGGTPARALARDRMPGAEWFPDVQLNYARHALRHGGSTPAIVAESQTRGPRSLSLDDLRAEVARCAAGLERLGVGPGDRVVGYLPNVPEAVIAFLATASLGAVWSSCSPEFGAPAVIDRWSDIAPTVMLAVDGYVHGDRTVDRRDEVDAIRDGLPTLDHVVTLTYLGSGTHVSALPWETLCTPTDRPLTFAPVAFDHPLFILFSSGTTGRPKAIVHSHGGILLEHLKALGLHHDLGPGDTFFWYSTTAWMMWNYLVSGLLVGTTILLFDGHPGHPDLDTLWQLAARHRVTVFGVSAPFLMACRKTGLRPGDDHDLAALRQVGSTGAPLPAQGFEWISDAVGPQVQVNSISGGTDVCTAFVGASPVLPVRTGRIPGPMLGCAVEAYDTDGTSVTGQQGELVVTRPMPSMPVGLWGDDGSRYEAAYFAAFPGVWCHGDWITMHEDGSCTITGRSDATLNRGGVRLGTADVYSVVEAFDEVADSLVVHLHDTDAGIDELILFLVPATGVRITDELRADLRGALRRDASPRHVPDRILEVPSIPRTPTGKRMEVPVKRALAGIRQGGPRARSGAHVAFDHILEAVGHSGPGGSRR